MGKTRLVCFDLDETLVRGTDSVKYLCILNGQTEHLPELDRMEAAGEISWIEADFLRAKLARGLEESKVAEGFQTLMRPISGAAETVAELRARGLRVVLITAGPIQVAKAAARLWGMDGYDGSAYEVVDGRFTGAIPGHLGDQGKIPALARFCAKWGIGPEECVAVGDGVSDVPLFGYCGDSIAINYAKSTAGKAKHYIKTDDLRDILQWI